MKYANIEKIFPEIESGRDLNEEDLYWIQVQYLLSQNIIEAIKQLLKHYEDSPDLVVSTIIVAHKCETVRETSSFPYSVFIKAIKERWYKAIECIEKVFMADKEGTIYLNLLYRICFNKTDSVQRILDSVEQLLELKISQQYLQDPVVWGLGRKRVGVWDIDDETLSELLFEDYIDISIITQQKLEYFRKILKNSNDSYISVVLTAALVTPGTGIEELTEYKKMKEELDLLKIRSLIKTIFKKCELICKFHKIIIGTNLNESNELIIDNLFANNTNNFHIQSIPTIPLFFKTIGEYKIPCFLDGLLMKSLENISKNANLDMAKRLAIILKRLLGDIKVKTNFCEFIKNLYNQDRVKETYDEKNNCSDSYALNIGFLLLEISTGIFRQDFIAKIGVNKFATFCFFYTMRLLEISINKHIRTFRQIRKETLLLQAFFAGHKLIASYFRFILDVVNTRKVEVFKEVIIAIEKMNSEHVGEVISSEQFILDKFTGLLDLSFKDIKANSVNDILKDNDFIMTFLLIQDCILDLFNNPQSFSFFSSLLIFKNTFHNSIIRAIFIHDTKALLASDSRLLPQLVRCYTDRFIDSIESNRFFLNTILIGQVMKNDRISLRMVNAMVSDLDTNLRAVLDSVIKINELTRKISNLEVMSNNSTIPDDLSEDEEARYVNDEGLANLLRNASDAQIRQNVEAYLRIHPDHQFEDIYNHFKTVSFRYTDPARYRLCIKIQVNKGRQEIQEKNLGAAVRLTNSYFNILIDFTRINRKLFLNRNIFIRLCTIINGALFALLGSKRAMYRLDKLKITISNNRFENSDNINNKLINDRDSYNPRVFLVSTLCLLINLLSRNILLINRSGFSSDILSLGLQIVTDKSLLSVTNITLLSDIISVLNENKSVEDNEEDIPEHFLDPLTCNLMEHPVKIITSNVILDKSTFNQIMLNDATDPFSRLPLTDSSYEECPKLQQEINDYLKNKREN